MKQLTFSHRISKAKERQSRHRHTRIPRQVENTPQPPSPIPNVLAFVLSILAAASPLLSTSSYQGNANLWHLSGFWSRFSRVDSHGIMSYFKYIIDEIKINLYNMRIKILKILFLKRDLIFRRETWY